MKKLYLSILFFISSSPLAFAAEITGVGNFSHIVADLGRAMEFYGGVLELEPNGPDIPFSDNPAIMRLGNTIGAQSRVATFKIPGSEMGIELIEYKDIPRKPIQTRFQDPGAAIVQLKVQDLDAILARLENSPAYIWTPSGEPVSLPGVGRIIFVKDPDGFFVELIESAPADGPLPGNVYGGNFELIINDTVQNAEFYREGLNFTPNVTEGFDDSPLLTNTVNTLGAGFRRTTLTVNNTDLNIAFLEFQNIARKPMNSNIQDPGTAILQLFSDDVRGMVQQLVAAGGTLITTGGEPVDIGGGILLAIVRDPNNLFIEVLPR